MVDIAGFWSYVHADNKNDGGGIINLATRLSREFEILSAEPLRLFVDRDDLRWGEEWKRRIDEALQQTTFFIPIITPSYFRSNECRRELLEFKSAAQAFGVGQLLLPIYYVTVPELEAEEAPEDELIMTTRETQREDMREIRLCDESDSRHRALVHSLASRLLEIAISTEEQSGSATEDSAGGSAVLEVNAPAMGAYGRDGSGQPVVPDGGNDDSEAGSLEILAAGEAALPEWNDTIQALSREIEAVGDLTAESTAEMQAENDAGTATFASRLAAANRLARRLDEPADVITRLGQDYAAHLIAVDPAIQTLIRGAREDEEVRNAPQTRTLFDTIRGMTQASREAMGQISELADAMARNSSVSRELRRPLKKIQIALRNISDAQRVQDDWELQINTLLGESLEPQPGVGE